MAALEPNLSIPPAEAALRLPASRDKASGRGVFPRIPEGSPVADRFAPITLSAEADLYSFTVIHPSPKTGLPSFVLVYADFPEEVRVFGRLDLPEGVRPAIGMRIAPVGVSAETYVFAPVQGGWA